MRRALSLATLLLVLTAAQFAALSIEPYGDSVYDLATGVTTLPQGGVIRDNAHDLSIDATYIEYVEGDYISAREAKMATEEVRFAAERMRYLPGREEVRLEGGVRFDSDRIEGLTAERGWIDLKAGVAVVDGSVRAAAPELTAARLVADYRAGEVLLVAPYTYQDAQLGVTLRGQNPEKPLYLRFDAETGEVRASSQLPPEVAERLLPYAKKALPDEPLE